MLTRYYETSPSTDYVAPPLILDGNTTLHEPPQLKYQDGTIPCIEPDEQKTLISRDRLIGYEEGLVYNFEYPLPAKYLFDGNLSLVESSIFPTVLGDGDTDYIEGNAPGSIAPVYESTLETGDIYLTKYVFKFDEFILFDDGSYVHFGPTVKKNSDYPLLRNIALVEDAFVNTIDLGIGYPKPGYIYSASATPYVKINKRTLQAFKGGPVEEITPGPVYKDQFGFNAVPLLLASSYSDDTGQVYDVNGNVTGYTKDYEAIAYDYTSSSYYLYNKLVYPDIVESSDGNTITIDHNEGQLKGAVLHNGLWYWCTLDYHSYQTYSISSKKLIQENIEKVRNRDLTVSVLFNKVK